MEMGSNRKIISNQRLRARMICKVIAETPTIKTLRFEDGVQATPGQFFMIWVPRVDEIPMSVSYTGALKGITVARIGETTARLQEMPVGTKLGIRGPYGKGYNISGSKKILAVGGGSGSASILPALDVAAKSGKKTFFAVGARSGAELLFVERAREIGVEVATSTDDGSSGHHGFVTDLIAPLLAQGNYDLVIACGPEQMLRKVVDIAAGYGISTQISLERYMKCGIGICDSCSIDGFQVCKDGPVFDGAVLMRCVEFGETRRDPCGREIVL